MAKIRIEQDPTFELTVSIPRVGKKPVDVPFTFKFLERERLAALADASIAHSREVAKLIASEKATPSEITAMTIKHQHEQLKEVLSGWGIEDEFNDENILAFVRSYASGPEAVLSAHNMAYQGAQEGN